MGLMASTSIRARARRYTAMYFGGFTPRETAQWLRSKVVLLLCLMALPLLAGCLTSEPASYDPPATKSPISDQEAFDRAKKAFLRVAKDPDSVKFDPTMYRRIAKGAGLVGSVPQDIVCGWANGKNSYGGYTGMQIFAYVIIKDSLID